MEFIMPKGTKVNKLKTKLQRKGRSLKSAIRIGQSYKTGRKTKRGKK